MRLIDADKVIKYPIRLDHYDKKHGSKQFVYGVESVLEYVDYLPTVEALPVDYIWDRAEFYEKQWLEDDNHWCKNVAEALRALLEDWEGEQGGGIFDKYENS